MNTEQMESRIRETYPNCQVAVIDMTGGGSNFEVRIAEESFNEMSRVKRHQAIMKIFADELASGEVHALAIKTLEI